MKETIIKFEKGKQKKSILQLFATKKHEKQEKLVLDTKTINSIEILLH